MRAYVGDGHPYRRDVYLNGHKVPSSFNVHTVGGFGYVDAYLLNEKNQPHVDETGESVARARFWGFVRVVDTEEDYV